LGSGRPDPLRALYLDLRRGQVVKGVERERRKGGREGKAEEVRQDPQISKHGYAYVLY